MRPFIMRALDEVLIQMHLAIAAVAAAPAFLAQMIGAGVLGALQTDARRLFFTDIADEWHGGDH